MLEMVKRIYNILPQSVSDVRRPETVAQQVNTLLSQAQIEKLSSARSLLQRIRELPISVKGSLAALVLTTEVAAAEAAFPPDEEYTVIPTDEILPDVTTIRFENDHIIIEDDAGLFLKHNFKKPESLADVGKMFVEPLSFGITFNLGKDNIIARVLTDSNNATQDPFIFTADIPYEYARDFATASAIDQQAMKADMTRKAKILIDQILPHVVGLSFHKDEVRHIDREGSVTVSQVTIDGFASPESDSGIGTKDPRNKQLSDMRAENAAHVLRRVFQEEGIHVKEMKYRGAGELPLTTHEREQLLQDAHEIKIDHNAPENQQLLELVKQYNNGTITEEAVQSSLKEIIGEKRKVAVTITTNERRFVMILPLPIFLPLAARLLRGLFEGDRLGINAVYAEFTLGPGSHNARLDRATTRHARQVGRDIRQNHFDPVQPRRDVVKGYSDTSQASTEYSQNVVRGARHRRKREGRQKVQLDFNPNLPLPDRVNALAFVVDRYLRMTPSLMSERNVIGQRATRDYDFMNIYEDREALQTLIERIARTDIDAMGLQRHLPPPNIPDSGEVRFQFTSGGLNPATPGGVGIRRDRVYGAYVWVDRVQYQLNRQALNELANNYIDTHRVVNAADAEDVHREPAGADDE